MEKREQIIELLNNCIIGESVSNTADAILLLFSVSGRSELLRAYFKWHKEQGFVSHKDSDIDDFLASNCH